MTMRKLRKGYVIVNKEGKAQADLKELDDQDPMFEGQAHKFEPVAGRGSEDAATDPVAPPTANRAIASAPKKRVVR